MLTKIRTKQYTYVIELCLKTDRLNALRKIRMQINIIKLHIYKQQANSIIIIFHRTFKYFSMIRRNLYALFKPIKLNSFNVVKQYLKTL